MNISFDLLNQWINVDNTSYLEIGRNLGVSGNYVKKLAKGLGVSLPKRNSHTAIPHNKGLSKHVYECDNCKKSIVSKSHRRYCDNKCQGEFRSSQKYADFLNNPEKYKTYKVSLLVKIFYIKRANL